MWTFEGSSWACFGLIKDSSHTRRFDFCQKCQLFWGRSAPISQMCSAALVLARDTGRITVLLAIVCSLSMQGTHVFSQLSIIFSCSLMTLLQLAKSLDQVSKGLLPSTVMSVLEVLFPALEVTWQLYSDSCPTASLIQLRRCRRASARRLDWSVTHAASICFPFFLQIKRASLGPAEKLPFANYWGRPELRCAVISKKFLDPKWNWAICVTTFAS